MPYYFMRDTPLQALEQLMMSQPGQKPRGGGIYRSPFRYTPEDVACEYCQNYVRKHPCRLCECTCLEERIEAGVLELNAFMWDCFTPGAGWSGSAGMTALTSKASGSEESSRSYTASTRRRRPLRSAAVISLSQTLRLRNWSQMRRST